MQKVDLTEGATALSYRRDSSAQPKPGASITSFSLPVKGVQ
jgi:hypothetical protein